MDCGQTFERTVDDLTGALSPEDAGQLRQHLETCAACREESARVRETWAALGRLPVPPPRADAADRFAGRLTADAVGAHAVHRSAPARASRRVAAAAVLLIGVGLSAFTGYRLGVASAGDADTGMAKAASPSGHLFLLLLHEGPDFRTAQSEAQQRAVVDEYRQWAGHVAAAGQLVSAEKLTDDGGQWLATAATPASPAGVPGDRVTGFFVIRASDYDEASRIAKQCPHLKYGGTIELRAVEKT